MDGQQEPVRYKSNVLFGSESDSVPVSLLTFSAGREKVKSPKGRNQSQQYQLASTSADEPKQQ